MNTQATNLQALLHRINASDHEAVGAAADLAMMLDAHAINEDELWNAIFDDSDAQVAAIEVKDSGDTATAGLLQWLLHAIREVRSAAPDFLPQQEPGVRPS